MAEAVAQAVDGGEHLLVQAGTGTGKSLAYLVPAVGHAVGQREPVVISTATLALQAQVVQRDLPRLADALEGPLGRRPTWQLVKGRANYVCRHKLDGGYPVEDEALFDLAPEAGAGPAVPSAAATSRLGRQVVRLREWAEGSATGDRDELVPGVGEQAWRQVSVSARECLGAQSCPQASACFSEGARHRARDVDIVVTNHAIVAIDAFEGRSLLPEHEVLVIDEAHELADRVTSVVTKELSVSAVEVAARRARAAGAQTTSLDDAAALLGAAFEVSEPGRLKRLGDRLGAAVAAVRDGAREVTSALKDGVAGRAGVADGSRQLARAAVGDVFTVAERLLAGAGPAPRARRRGHGRTTITRPMPDDDARHDPDENDPDDVVWFSRTGTAERGQRAALTWRRCRWPPPCGSGCSVSAPWCSPRRPWPSAAASRRAARTLGLSRAARRRRGAGSTSAARSTTRARRSSTWPGTCRRPAATASGPRCSTSSRRWSMRREGAPSVCSPRAGPPRRRPRCCASGSTSRCCARATT